MTHLVLSSLAHTWLIDIDGTILKHNGHLVDGDELLIGVYEFWSKIPENDIIILLTARSIDLKNSTESFLIKSNLRYNCILYDIPFGERILLNDKKPSGMLTAFALNLDRDSGLSHVSVEINQLL